jgi:outer membrane protein OmpA-like peptidoglycan-associated protein
MRRKDFPAVRVAGAAVAVAALVAGVAGCGPTSTAKDLLAGTCLTNGAAPLALAVGARSNVPTARFPPAVGALLQTAANDQQQISLIRIDGQPKIFMPQPFSTTAQNGPARQAALNKYLNGTIEPILRTTIHARVPEADILTALNLATSATGPDGNIIVIDSGLQTVAPLQYQQRGMMMAQPADIVSFLRQQKLIPDLRGRHVLLSGFGYTAAPQPVLNQAERDNVIAQWEAIIRAGGGCVTADTVANTTAEVAGVPEVAIAQLPPPTVIHPCGTTVLNDSGSVGFVVGTATFRNPSAADATLRQLASTLKGSDEPVTLIGSTSSEGGDAVNNPLSQQRADAVKSTLVSMGIASGRITSTGEGSHYHGRVIDLGPGGELLPAQAEQDREVIVQLPSCR